jgi:FtsP/CotA-like multicopper oxidase with cupredoxin domain
MRINNDLSQPVKLVDARHHSQSVALSVERGETAFFAGRASRTLGFNGSYLGPTLRLHRGDQTEIAITNRLRNATALHWHGLLVPTAVDGRPHQPVAPGAAWRPVLRIDQLAATLWYHAHTHGRTAEQVYAGLAGMLIVTDEIERTLELPSDYGIDDLPLVLQDRAFTRDGRLVYPESPMTVMHGARGDTILVNGTVNPVARVPGRLVRLRLLNAANARSFDLSFDDDRVFHWIASDGGLLERPVERRSICLAPGERAEILVDFSSGRAVALRTEPDDDTPMGMMGRMGGFGLQDGVRTVLRFEPRGPGNRAAIPERLVARESLDSSGAVRRRQFMLTMGMGGMMAHMLGGGMGHGMMARGMGGGMVGHGMGPGMACFGINGRAFDMNRIDTRVRLGDVEIWEVSGEMMVHPFHIHGVHFEVLSRNGAAPGPRDQGLRDTVVAQEPVELLVRFTQPAVAAPFMYHCHILEHEDNGMMGQFVVR